MTFVVGQTVYAKYRHPNSPSLRDRPITKIGRKWVYIGRLGDERFHIGTHKIDGGGYASPGQIYLSEDEYHDEVHLTGKWREFQTLVRSASLAPPGVTVEDIYEAQQLITAKERSK